MKATWKVTKFVGGGFVLMRTGDGVKGHPLTTIHIDDREDAQEALGALVTFLGAPMADDTRKAQEEAAWAVHKMNSEDDEVA